MKGLKSPDRGKALAGTKNAAWDVTYLSELIRRAKPENYGQARCIFVSADRALADLAPLLLIDAEDQQVYRDELAGSVRGGGGTRAASSIPSSTALMPFKVGLHPRDVPVSKIMSD